MKRLRPFRRTKHDGWLWMGELGFWCRIPMQEGIPILESIEDHAVAMRRNSRTQSQPTHVAAWEFAAEDAIYGRIDLDDDQIYPVAPNPFQAPTIRMAPGS